MSSLNGKTALVTGASRGIGADTAVALAKAGAKVACAARTVHEGDNPHLEGSLEKTVAEIESAGGEAIAIAANLAEAEECEQLVATARKRLGDIDLLVNNAAVGFFGPTVDLSPGRWDLSWSITVTAPLYLSRLVLPSMLERRSGRIVNVSSESAISPGRAPYLPEDVGPGDTAYGAQKAAVERLTQGLAREVYGAGVGVAAIAPSQLVPTPGALFNDLVTGSGDPDAEPTSYMPAAICLLATMPLGEMSGRVVYSQQLLVEQKALAGGTGIGVDPELPISGFAAAASAQDGA